MANENPWFWTKCWLCHGRRFVTKSGPSRLCPVCGGDGSILVKLDRLAKAVTEPSDGREGASKRL